MAKVVGIDLGTTYSVTAVLDGPQPRVIESIEGRREVRSVVSLREGEVLVGDPAYGNWPLQPKNTIISIKRLMGRSVADTHVEEVGRRFGYDIVEPSDGTRDSVRVVMGGKQYSPVEISSLILGKLKADVKYRTQEDVAAAVVTVPAYFSEVQRNATRQAALKAGIRVIRLLDEPSAAAVAYSYTLDPAARSEPRHILVYDLGGGTFDVSVGLLANDVFAQLDLEGDMWLGGDDFDELLVQRALRHLKTEKGIEVDREADHRFVADCKIAAQTAKEQLSSASTAWITVAGLLSGRQGELVDLNLKITRSEYEKMISPLVQRTVELVLKAVEGARLTLDEIDCVLMAGNATMTPLVRQAMVELFGPDRVLTAIHPKHSVALGAAIVAERIGPRKVFCQAHPDPANPEQECGYVNEVEAVTCFKCHSELERCAETPVVVVKIAPFPYGLQTAGDRFNVFVHKGDVYETPPEKRQTQPFFTQAAGQRMISLPVYGGTELERASANEKMGEAFAILPPGLREGTAVRVRIWLDANQNFQLSAELEDGTHLHPWIIFDEQDHEAIVLLEKEEKTLARKGAAVSPSERAKLNLARESVFDRLKAGLYAEAVEEARQLSELAERAGSEPKTIALEDKARSLIGFAQYVLTHYGWGLDAGTAYRLTGLVEEVKAALDNAEPNELKQKVGELDRATDYLPDAVAHFLGLESALASRLRPLDMAKARALEEELWEIREAFRANDGSAQGKLVAFDDKVRRAIGGAETRSNKPFLCPRGHSVPPGERFCPECKRLGIKEDVLLLRTKLSGTSISA